MFDEAVTAFMVALLAIGFFLGFVFFYLMPMAWPYIKQFIIWSLT